MSAVTQGPAAAGALTGLARALVQQGKLRPDRAENFARKAAQSNTQFIDELTNSADVTGLSASSVARFAAETFGHPMLDLAAFDLEQLPRDIIDRKLVAGARVLALRKRGNRLAIAVSDPTNFAALDQVKFQTQLALDVIVVEHDKLLKLVEAQSQSVGQKLEEMAGGDDVSFDDLLGESPDQAAGDDAAQLEIDDAPVVRFLQKLLLDAIGEGASDLHFEPYEKFYRVRFRVDGILREVAQPPLAIRERLSARIKVVSKLDISEKRVPQDGRMKLALSGQRAIDFRVSTLPTMFGEKIVMRILDPSQAKLGIDALGYEPDQKEALAERRAATLRHGAGDRADGIRQDRVALHVPEHPEPAGHQYLDGGGSRGNSARRDQSGQCQRKSRPHVCERAACVPAPGSGRHHGRRDPRPRNRRHRDQGGADRPHGAVHPAHQRCGGHPGATAEHGRGALQRGVQRHPDHGTAPRPQAVRLQAAGRRPQGCAGHAPDSAART